MGGRERDELDAGDADLALPRAPIHRLIGPLERFLHVEAAGGILLLACTAVALVAANSPAAHAFHDFWQTEAGISIGSFALRHTLEEWINDGLMTLFFFVVGLEVKRELVLGELRDPRRAALPVVAAAGGMVVPAAIYFARERGGPAAGGWGIPMATDIAFVVGCMALLGPRIPAGLRIMLLSLAIADDIGAIVVIAVGYSAGIHADALLLAGAGIAATVALRRLGVRSFGVYVVVGGLVWLAVHHSGIHATIAGVVLGLLTPSRPLVHGTLLGRLVRRESAALERAASAGGHTPAASVRALRRAAREAVSPLVFLETSLHPWVAFAIMPLFALANAGVPLEARSLGDSVAWSVAAGLLLGKPIGIVAFSWVAARAGLVRLPDGVGWGAVAGAGLLAGIGFTMALFIDGLALQGDARDAAKVGILAASAVAAAAGMAVLVWSLPHPAKRA